MRRPEIVFIYRVEGKNCLVAKDGAQTKVNVSATFHDSRQDSHELRDEFLSRIVQEIGGVDLTQGHFRYSLGGFVPRQFADDDSIHVTSAVPQFRARATLVFDVAGLSGEALDVYYRFGKALNRHLQATSAGFVDGDDLSEGAFSVYCFGKDKQALLDSIHAFAESAPAEFRLE